MNHEDYYGMLVYLSVVITFMLVLLVCCPVLPDETRLRRISIVIPIGLTFWLWGPWLWYGAQRLHQSNFTAARQLVHSEGVEK